jgi:hypothetical protein
VPVRFALFCPVSYRPLQAKSRSRIESSKPYVEIRI